MSSSAVQSWLGKRVTRPDGSEAVIPTRFAAIEVGVHRRLAEDAVQVVAPPASVMLVCDQGTEPYLKPVHEALQQRGFALHVHVAPNEADGSPPAPDDAGALVLLEELRKCSCTLAVSVGSGTMNDRTKYAAHLAGIPYLCYATAASMNGYNSPIVAIYVDGLKSSVPATPPVGMYADPEVIVKAPRLMHLAGLGDLCSKPFAGADAVIADILANKEPWRLPSDMVEDAFMESLENAEAIGKEEPKAIAQLMEALWISGFSMTLAGTSAPASGGEHLWSHRIDMAQHDAHQPLRALHGTQVGIACALVKPLFAAVAPLSLDALRTHLERLPDIPPDPQQSETFAAWIAERHGELGERSRAAVLLEATKKYNRATRTHTRRGLIEHWPAIQRELQLAHHHAERIDMALARATAPTSPQDIQLSPQESARILRVCRDIRNRFTILDLHAEIFGES